MCNDHKQILSSLSYADIGNIAHVMNLIIVLCYSAIIVKYAHPNTTSSIVDEEWLTHGFCVANPKISYWNSHDLCLYVDTLLSLVLMRLYYSFRHEPIFQKDPSLLQAMKWGPFSILSHGFAHGFIAYNLRQEDEGHEGILTRVSLFEQATRGDLGDAHDMTMMVSKAFVVLYLFWFTLLKTSIPSTTSNITVAFIVPVIISGHFCIPPQLGFTYVQTIIYLTFISKELLSKTKDDKSTYAYMILACAFFPNAIIPYWEAFFCTSGSYKNFGGHVLYDASIPLALVVSYWMIYCHGKKHYPEGKDKLS